MTSSETISVCSFQAEQIHKDNYCGLIDIGVMDRFHRPDLEPDLPGLCDKFDTLCAESDGIVHFEGKAVRVDCYLENSNVIRSIVIPFEPDNSESDQNTTPLFCISLISHFDGKLYFETHIALQHHDGTIDEPAIGDSTITPGTHADFVMYNRVIDDAAPLPQSR